MEYFLVYFLFAVGLLLIIKGGDYFVDASSWIAEVSGIPKFIVGATIVSVATTLPEMIVSSIAAMQGKIDMAVGNAVGSVTANSGLIMGISIICLPVAIKAKNYLAKSILLILSVASLAAFSLAGKLSPYANAVLIIIFIVFIYENIKHAKSSIADEKLEIKGKGEVVKNIAMFLLGCAGIVIGANLLVDNGTKIALLMGVPEGIIAVTMVAIGTSLPELVTTITAILKKQSSLSVGNIIGANIIDLTLILPVCSIVSHQSLPISAQTYMLDLPVCLIVICIAIIPALLRSKFSRWQGITTIVLYISYLVVLVKYFGV